MPRRNRTRGRRTRPRLSYWRPSPWNPRAITPAARAALGGSLRTFGDLSGFVVNGRTGAVICGHQRRECLGDVELSRVELGPARRVELGREGGRFVSTEREGWAGRPAAAIFRSGRARGRTYDRGRARRLCAGRMGGCTKDGEAK